MPSRGERFSLLRLAIALLCSLLFHLALLALWGGAGTGQILRNDLHARLMIAETSFRPVAAETDDVPESPETAPEISSRLPQEKTEERKGKPAPAEPLVRSGATEKTGQEVSHSQALEAERQRSVEAQLAARRASYLLSARLDTPPEPLMDIQAEYPESAGNQQGRVRLRLFVNENGEVDEVLVVTAVPPGFFEEAAIRAFSLARFSPGLQAGRAVKFQMVVEVDFVPFDRGADVSGRRF